MRIEVIEPGLSTPTNFLRIYIESRLDFDAVREIVLVEQPFPFKGDPELIAKLKAHQGQQAKDAEKKGVAGAFEDEEEIAEKKRIAEEKARTQQALLNTEDPPLSWYDKDWQEVRESERKKLRAEQFGGEDLLGAHAHIAEMVVAIEFNELETLVFGEEETLAFSELLEAYLKKKATEKKKKEAAEGEGGDENESDQPPEKTPEEQLFDALLGMLNTLKKEGARLRNRKKTLTKTKNRSMAR